MADTVDIPINPKMPIPLAKYLKTLVKTTDEVWSHLLTLENKGQNKTLAEWSAALDALKTRKV